MDQIKYLFDYCKLCFRNPVTLVAKLDQVCFVGVQQCWGVFYVFLKDKNFEILLITCCMAMKFTWSICSRRPVTLVAFFCCISIALIVGKLITSTSIQDNFHNSLSLIVWKPVMEINENFCIGHVCVTRVQVFRRFTRIRTRKEAPGRFFFFGNLVS